MGDDKGTAPAGARVPETEPTRAPDETPIDEHALERLRLRVQVEKETKGTKEKLNHRESPLSQEEALVGAGIRTKMLIIELMEAKVITPENVDGLADFSQFLELLSQIDIQKTKLSNEARQAILDLLALRDSTSSLHQFWINTWPSLIVAAKSWKAELGAGIEKQSAWKGKVKTFYENHRTLCNVAGMALLAGGLYWLFKPKKKAATEEELKGSVASSWGITAGVIAGVGAALYFGWEHVKKFLGSMGISMEDLEEAKKLKEQVEKGQATLKQAKETAKEEGVKAAGIDAMTDGDTKPEKWQKDLSNTLTERYKHEFDPRAMRFFRKFPYKKFRQETPDGRISSWLKSIGQTMEFPGVNSTVAGLLSSSAANMNRLFETLEESEDIDPEALEDKTLEEVLQMLKEKLEKGEIEAERVNRDVIDVSSAASKEVIRSYKDFIESFLEDTEGMANMLGNGAIKQTIEGWKLKIEKDEFGALDTYHMTADIMKACWENGVPLAIGAGTMAVWNGTKWWVLARAEPIAQAAGELLGNGLWPGDWKVNEAMKVYGIASTPLVVLGMAKGAVMSQGRLLRTILWEGGKGFAAPIKVMEFGYDTAWYGTRALRYGTSVKRTVLSMVKYNIGGRSIHTIQNIPLLRRMVNAETAIAIRQRYIVERIIALETQQALLKYKTEHKLSVAAGKNWRAKYNKLADKIKNLKLQYGQLAGSNVAGHDVTQELDQTISQARLEYMTRMYPKLPKEVLKLIQGNAKLRDLFLTEGYGSPIIRRVLRMKDPKPFLELLNRQGDILKKLKQHPEIVRSRGFRRVLTMAERLPSHRAGALMEAMAQDARLAELMTDPAILRNRQFLIDLEKGIKDGTLARRIVRPGKIPEKATLNLEMVKIQAEAARTVTRYQKFKAAVAEGLKKAGQQMEKTKMGQRAKAGLNKATRRVKMEVVIRRFQMEQAYRYAAEKLNLVTEPVKKGAAAAKAWAINSSAARELARLKAGPPTLHSRQRIPELEKIVEREVAAAEKTIEGNKQLKAAWEEYQTLIQKAREAGTEIGAMNQAEFVKSRSLWMNAAKLGGMAFLIALVHGFENADNKVDFLVETPLELATFGAGVKLGVRGGAALGARVPAPGVARLACMALGAVAGYFGSEAVGAAYDWLSKSALDRWFVNRGRGEGWDTVGDVLEMGMGAGVNNVRALLDFYDAGIMDLDEEDLFVEEENGESVPNLFYYQQYLSASEVQITTSGLEKHYFRDAGKFDEELEQLAVRMEQEAGELEKERSELMAELEEAFDEEKEKELDELEDKIDQKYSRATIIREQFKIGNNPAWLLQQEMYHAGIEDHLEQFRPAFVEQFSKELGEQEEVAELMENLKQRLLSGEGDLIRTEREDQLWVRLRDEEVIVEIEEDGVMVKKEMEFKEWFLRLRQHAGSYRTFSEIRDKGRMGSKKKEKGTHIASREADIEQTRNRPGLY